MELCTSRTRMLSCRGDLLERARPISAKEAAYAAAVAELGGQQDGLRRQRSTNNAIQSLLSRRASLGTTPSRSASCSARALMGETRRHDESRYGRAPRQDRGERLTNTITFYIDCPFVAGVVGGGCSIRTAAAGHLRL